jgi:hypothetical protein
MVMSFDGQQATADGATSVGFSGRQGFTESSLRFLASFIPLPPVALMIPIFHDRLVDNLSTNQASPTKEGTVCIEKLLMDHHPATSIAFHIKLPQIVPVKS